MRKLLSVLVVVAVVLLSSCGEGFEITINLNVGVDTIEVNESWIDSGATFDNGTQRVIVYSDDMVDTSTLGEYEITYGSVYEDIDYNITRYVMVTDQIAPILSLLEGVDTVTVNTSWTDGGCEVADNSLEQLNCATSSVVDITTAGVYEVVYTAVDSSGNEGTIARIVTVVQ